MAQDDLQSQSEQEIQFKKRARRRLVGAIALVLLMIVLLPMLLENKVAQGHREDVVISIPSQDNQLDTKASPEPAKLPEVAQSSTPPSTETSAPVAQNPVVANETKPAEIKPADVKPVEVKPVDPPAPVVENKPAAQNDKPVTKPADTPPPQEPRPAKKEEAKPKPTDTANKADKPAAKGNFLIQIGVFSDPENVKKLEAKLSDSGLKPRGEVIDTPTGKATRLRVGPFSSRNDAEAALVKVKALSIPGQVVGN